MQINPWQMKNFEILRDCAKGGSQIGTRPAALANRGGAVASASIPKLRSYAKELLQGRPSSKHSFCADCHCRFVQTGDGLVPPISRADSICQIFFEAACFGDHESGRCANQGHVQCIYPFAERICANKLVLKRVSAPVRIFADAGNHAGNDDLRKILELQSQSEEISGIAVFPVTRDTLVDSVEQWLPRHVSCPPR